MGASARADLHEDDVLTVPGGLGRLLPAGGIAKGSVVLCSGNSLMNGLLAAVTGSGKFAAVVGCRRLGLLSMAEMGADLSRLAHIPEPGDEGLSALAVLLDGLDLVVIDLAGASVPPSRSRALVARARSHRSVIVVTGGTWTDSDLVLEARPAAYHGIGRGHGRLRSIHLDVHVSGKGMRPRSSRIVLAGDDPAHTAWTIETAPTERVG